ncbi:MAG: lyase [Rhodospirillaceae bacterium]|nr:lyase [Rhodospirillaceae bacterium]
MIDHVSIVVGDLSTAARFYDAVLAPLGHTRLVERETTVGFGKRYPEFWINLRSGAAAPSDGFHVCLRARSPEAVRAFHAAALTEGGTDDGAPGFRPEYHASYFAAFVRDPDGNRIEVVTFVRD